MRIGFIGTGSMGGMLVRSYVRSQKPDIEVAAFNRTPAKLQILAANHPEILVMDSAVVLTAICDVIFICVKPKDVQPVLTSIKSALNADKYLISINSAWSIESLEQATPCKVVKIIPSITQEALSGVILTIYGSRLTPADQASMHSLLKVISEPQVIREEDVRICSDLTSCGPAFFSFLLSSFTSASVRQGGISKEQATALTKHMIYGLSKLLVEEDYSFEKVIQRVSVPGGITSEGLNILEPSMDGVFDELFIATKLKQSDHSR